VGRGPAIACRYCRTGSALRWLQTHAAAELEREARKKRRKKVEGPEPEPELHDPGCRTAAFLPRDLHLTRDGDERTLFCQACGQSRVGDAIIWALYVADLMECPRCRRVTRHHPAPREAVEGEMCLCGACRTRRAFAEAAS